MRAKNDFAAAAALIWPGQLRYHASVSVPGEYHTQSGFKMHCNYRQFEVKERLRKIQFRPMRLPGFIAPSVSPLSLPSGAVSRRRLTLNWPTEHLAKSRA